MAALWKGVWCEANQWTELSAAKLSVLVNLPKTGTLYIATTTGATPTATPDQDASPGTPEYDFGTITNLKPYGGTFLDGTTSVFGWPEGAEGLRAEVQSE
jgi:hypothetical protein